MLYVNPLANPYAARTDAAVAELSRRRTAVKELEHFFALTLMQEMRKSVPRTNLLDGGPASEFYQEMLDDVLSGAMAESGQLGIAKMIEQQLEIAARQKELQLLGAPASLPAFFRKPARMPAVPAMPFAGIVK